MADEESELYGSAINRAYYAIGQISTSWTTTTERNPR